MFLTMFLTMFVFKNVFNNVFNNVLTMFLHFYLSTFFGCFFTSQPFLDVFLHFYLSTFFGCFFYIFTSQPFLGVFLHFYLSISLVFQQKPLGQGHPGMVIQFTVQQEMLNCFFVCECKNAMLTHKSNFIDKITSPPHPQKVG